MPALTAALIGACVAGCAATVPPAVIDPEVLNLPHEIVVGETFRHVIYHGRGTGGSELHVYLEGDGVPYLASGIVARDPTSRSLLMLRLMNADPAPSLYVGRPCYLGLYAEPPCAPSDWTLRRFSPEVIASLHKVIADQALAAGAARVILIGHSGGGALAVILAHELDVVAGVITIGGNLDTDAWARRHGFPALTGSVNPAALGPLPARVAAVHLVGSKDRVTPRQLVANAAVTIGGSVVVFDGFSHVCCWTDVWPGAISLLH